MVTRYISLKYAKYPSCYFIYSILFVPLYRMDNAVLIQGATLSDIERMINKAVESRLADFYSSLQKKEPVLIKRKDAAAFLGISLPTLDAYGRCGILHPRHIGGRVFFSEEELMSVKRG